MQDATGTAQRIMQFDGGAKATFAPLELIIDELTLARTRNALNA
jgi:hypothetical protein